MVYWLYVKNEAGIMKKETIKKELQTRRKKVQEFYDKGFCIIEIARYFEVSCATIQKSLRACGIETDESVDGKDADRKILPYKKEITAEIRKRDILLTGKSEDEIYAEGFWRMPTAFTEAHKEADEESALQKEMRIIGIKRKDIAAYLGYGSSVEKVTVMRENDSDIRTAQRTVRDKLKSRGWVAREIMEFTGMASGSFSQKEADVFVSKSRIDNGEKMPSYEKNDKKKKLIDEVYALYHDAGKTQQQIADELGLTRRTVITYIRQYEIQEFGIEHKHVKKPYQGGGKRSMQEKICKELQDEKNGYLIKENGKYRCAPGWDYVKIAKALETNELTISKYIKLLNGNESK